VQLKQKDQIATIKQFRAYELNTLISTSIGEEGLDIGEVDLIICYDSGMSPIRMVQRMGRTGRKREGRVYLLLMEGKEAEKYQKATKKSQSLKDNIRGN
jgi:ATP-dependent DNA helicase MPH1